MPMFAEQLRNSWMAREWNFAVFINKQNVTAESLELAVKEVLSNGKYQTSVSRIRSLFEDRPIQALDLSSFWFRRLLKYGGKMPDMFYRRALRNSFFVHFHLDFLITVSLLVFAFSYIIS